MLDRWGEDQHDAHASTQGRDDTREDGANLRALVKKLQRCA
jgi:hypothetical protein